jgi:hypothetical protein
MHTTTYCCAHTRQGSTLRGIHERVADGLPLDVPFPDQGSHLGSVLRGLTKEVIQQHARCMKRAILYHKLKHSEAARAKHAQLRLPEPPALPAQRWFGKVS